MHENKAAGSQKSTLGKILEATIYHHAEKNTGRSTHSGRVSYLCRHIGMAMELSETNLFSLELSGLFHDIGKAAIQDYIINKPGPLTALEWREVMLHPDVGFWILSTSLKEPDLAEYVLCHHERYDGLGYPKGLKAEQIPLLSRIISVADSYDAMTNHRPYKDTLKPEMAVQELIRNRGKQFDPEIVDIFVKKFIPITM